MTAANYTPREGSVAKRLVDYLRSRPADEWVVTAALAEACETESQSVNSYLAGAVNARLVVRQQVPGTRLWAWRIATEADLVKPTLAGEEQGDPSDDDADKTPPSPPAALGSIFNLAASGIEMPRTVIEKPAPEPKDHPAPAPAAMQPWEPVPKGKLRSWLTLPQPQTADDQIAPVDGANGEFGCALWNNGVLMLSVDGTLVELSAERTRELVRYLERMAEVPA